MDGLATEASADAAQIKYSTLNSVTQPQVYATLLNGVSPNPVSESASIDFSLAESGPVNPSGGFCCKPSLSIFNGKKMLSSREPIGKLTPLYRWPR